MITVVTSGEIPLEVDGPDWEDLLTIPGHTVVDGIVIHNEGDFSGFWRLHSDEGDSASARLAAGGGETGERRACTTVPCKGFSGGVLQVKKGLMGGNLSGLFAWGVKE